MGRMERLREIKSGRQGVKGASSKQSNLDAFAARASENSLHPGKSKSGTAADGPGRDDKNHLGSDYLPGVRRES